MVARASQKQAVNKMASAYARLKWVSTMHNEIGEINTKTQNLCELVTM